VPTFALDKDGKVIIWNRACERLTGIVSSEVMGTKDHWKAFYEQPRLCLADILVQRRIDQLDQLYPWHAGMGKNGIGLKAENWCVMPRIGKRLYLAIDTGPIYDHEGDLFAVVETLRDITEHKTAETTLETLANRDGLTNLANRRLFDQTLKTAFQRAQRTRIPFALLLLDVDHFKMYNDVYGHLKGDECLKEVAKAIGDHSLREEDLAARYGGEEFAVILPATDRDGACQAAERIRNSVLALDIPHSSNRDLYRVSVSIGVTSAFPKGNDVPDTFIHAADTALYHAKQNGRNRIAYKDMATPDSVE